MPLSFKKLCKILKAYNAWEDSSRGKGGHTAFLREVDGRTQLFPMPKKKEVLDSYVKAIRRKFKLTPQDGISDDEFFGNS